MISLAIGFLLSALVGMVAYRRGSLTGGGVIGAILTGTIIFGFGGLAAAALLVAFFVSSTVLSHWRERDKEPLAEKFQKGSRRDFAQALANGGIAGLCALAYFFYPRPIIFAALAGALATVTADTWATEIGVLSQTPPRLITNLRPVPVGTSGGITLVGTMIALLGAVFIASTAVLVPLGANLMFTQSAPPAPDIFLPVSVSGLLGSLFDSLLGATVQAIYYCDYDRRETESAVHKCGRATRLIRGWKWLDNDGVNFLASAFGAGLAALAYALLQV